MKQIYNENILNKKMKRRSFLKTTGAVGAAAAFGGGAGRLVKETVGEQAK